MQNEVDYTAMWRGATARYILLKASAANFYTYYENELETHQREFHRRLYPWFIGAERNIAQPEADLDGNTPGFGRRVRHLALGSILR